MFAAAFNVETSVRVFGCSRRRPSAVPLQGLNCLLLLGGDHPVSNLCSEAEKQRSTALSGKSQALQGWLSGRQSSQEEE